MSIFIVYQRQPKRISAQRFIAAPGEKRVDDLSDTVWITTASHSAGGAGIEIGERVPIPDDMIPADAYVEIAAKKAAGYYTPEPQDPDNPVGRPLEKY